MNSLWSRLYDPAKDRRYGVFFLIMVVIFLSVFALGMFVGSMLDELDIHETEPHNYFLQALPGIAILIVALRWRRTRQMRQKEKFQRQELSRDEIRKARSKLTRTKY